VFVRVLLLGQTFRSQRPCLPARVMRGCPAVRPLRRGTGARLPGNRRRWRSQRLALLWGQLRARRRA
jgi:hypothetical protein